MRYRSGAGSCRTRAAHPVISDAEANTLRSNYLTPDSDLDGDGTNDAGSVGFGVRMVPASF